MCLMVLNIQLCRNLAFQKCDLSCSPQVLLQTQQVPLFLKVDGDASLPPFKDPLSVKVPDTEEFVPKAGTSQLTTETMKMALHLLRPPKLHKLHLLILQINLVTKPYTN